MKKLGFLSLEYIIGENTYWLTSGNKLFSFTEIPLSVFAGKELNAQNLRGDKTFSEITPYEDKNGKKVFVFSSDNGANPVNLDLNFDVFPNLTWNDFVVKIIESNENLEDFSALWHLNVVELREGSEYKFNCVKYKVTAFLPPPNQEGILAIYGEDYVAGSNPNWITIRRETVEEYKNMLKQFKVVMISFGNQYYLV